METAMAASRTPRRIGGTLTALITPFRNGALDRIGLLAHAEWQIRNGIDGLVACGIPGEGPVLTERERAQVITACIEVTGDKVPVIAASGTSCTKTTIEETQRALSLGADAALVTLPYYSKPTQAGVIRHFEALAESVDMPLIVHNAPGHTAMDLAPATIERLAAIPSVIGIADGTGDIARAAAWRLQLPDRVALFSTHDATAHAFASTSIGIGIGIGGIISSAANVMPRLVCAMQRVASAGNLSAALALRQRLQPLFAALSRDSEPAAIKHALHLLRGTSADVRLPLVGVEPDVDAAIRDALAPFLAEDSCGNLPALASHLSL